MCSEPPTETRGVSAQGASPPDPGDARHHPSHPEGRYREERVRLPAQEDARLVFLRGAVDEGKCRGWRMVSALREPDGQTFLLTWDTQGAPLG